jgi:hypothetical protein
MIHRLVLWRSTTGWRCHILPLLGLLVGTGHIVCDDDVTDELRE